VSIGILAFAALGVFALYLSVTATYHLVRSHIYDQTQKTLQLVLIWLLPLVGAWAVLYFLAEGMPRHTTRDSTVPSPDAMDPLVAWWALQPYQFFPFMGVGVNTGGGDHASHGHTGGGSSDGHDGGSSGDGGDGGGGAGSD
jgi:uncharacterized membrane protein YgcG